jgi:RNA polymerase sigma-70 factor (ECF subfamily)
MGKYQDTALLQAFKKGDITAFEAAFKRYFKQLRVEAFLLLKNQKDAEDLVQELFLDIWNKQLYRNVQHTLGAYLHMAIRNKCLNYLEKEKRVQKKAQAYNPSLTIQPEERELSLPPFFQSALNKLPAQRLKAFTLVYMEEKKYEEAAAEMGISINSIKSHLKLAIRSLKNHLHNIK